MRENPSRPFPYGPPRRPTARQQMVVADCLKAIRLTDRVDAENAGRALRVAECSPPMTRPRR